MNIGKLVWVDFYFNTWRSWLFGVRVEPVLMGDWLVMFAFGPLVLEIGSPLEED